MVIWIWVHLQRVFTTPALGVPRNGPHVVSDLLVHLDRTLFGAVVVELLYRPVLQQLGQPRFAAIIEKWLL